MNPSAVDGGLIQIFQNDPMSFFVCISDVAADFVFRRDLRLKAEGNHRLVAFLLFQLGKIDAAAVNTGGCAGLKAAEGDAMNRQIGGQSSCRSNAIGAAGIGDLADVDGSV